MLKYVTVLGLLLPSIAFAQQQATPEIQAASQMLQQAQAQEFALRVELAKLKAENEKLKEAKPKG